MREKVLAEFFAGKASANRLAHDLEGSVKQVRDRTFVIEIEDMEDDLEVTPEMAVSLCDAVLAGELSPQALETIAFALVASDKFAWDADKTEVLAEVIHDWSAPEANYPLTIENVRRFREWLRGIEPYPTKPISPEKEQSSSARERVIKTTEKKRIYSR